MRRAALPLHARVRQEAQLRQLHMPAGGQYGLSFRKVMNGWMGSRYWCFYFLPGEATHAGAAIHTIYVLPGRGTTTCIRRFCHVKQLLSCACCRVVCAGVPLGSLRRVPSGGSRHVPVRQDDARRPVVYGQGAHVRGHLREAAAVRRPQASKRVRFRCFLLFTASRYSPFCKDYPMAAGLVARISQLCASNG